MRFADCVERRAGDFATPDHRKECLTILRDKPPKRFSGSAVGIPVLQGGEDVKSCAFISPKISVR